MTQLTKTLKQETNNSMVPLTDAMVANDAGAGLEVMAREDFAVPRLRIIQKLSSELDPQSSGYVDGAEAGDIYDPIAKGLYNKGILLVPVSFRRSYTEWTPRAKGGGLVKDHGSDSSILDETDHGYPPLLPNGNEVVFAMEYLCLAVDPDGTSWRTVVITFSKSQIKKAKVWNSRLANTFVTTATGARVTAPIYSQAYRFSTTLETNAMGSWYGWKIQPDRPVLKFENGDAIYREARRLRGSLDGAGSQLALEAASAATGIPVAALPTAAVIDSAVNDPRVNDSDIPF